MGLGLFHEAIIYLEVLNKVDVDVGLALHAVKVIVQLHIIVRTTNIQNLAGNINILLLGRLFSD